MKTGQDEYCTNCQKWVIPNKNGKCPKCKKHVKKDDVQGSYINIYDDYKGPSGAPEW